MRLLTQRGFLFGGPVALSALGIEEKQKDDGAISQVELGHPSVALSSSRQFHADFAKTSLGSSAVIRILHKFQFPHCFLGIQSCNLFRELVRLDKKDVHILLGSRLFASLLS
jgi:hypothetical protein